MLNKPANRLRTDLERLLSNATIDMLLKVALLVIIVFFLLAELNLVHGGADYHYAEKMHYYHAILSLPDGTHVEGTLKAGHTWEISLR